MNELNHPVTRHVSPFEQHAPLTRSLTRYLNSHLSPQLLKQVQLEVSDFDNPARTHIYFNQDNRFAKTVEHSFPIVYQRKKIGALNLLKSQDTPPNQTQLSQITRQLAVLVRRNSVQSLSHHHLGHAITLMGYSESIMALEKTIERIAESHCPVFIRAEPGSEVLDVACKLHFSGPSSPYPFYEIDCAGLDDQQFSEKLHYIAGQLTRGCVFLNNLESLNQVQQGLLCDMLTTRSHHNTVHSTINLSQVRLITASTEDIKQRVTQGQFIASLWQKLNFFSMVLPPLRERRDDILPLVDLFTKRHRLYREQRFSEAARAMLHNYDWPDNTQELEKTVLRLLTCAPKPEIDTCHIQALCPNIRTNNPLRAEQVTTSYIQALMDQELGMFSKFHPSLQKALSYISTHWQQDVSLGTLAANAYVSASHLSYLFKRSLNRSFKQILAELRIRHACRMLEENPNLRITDLCMDVGFGDLSHFEKIFRRYTQVSPREYKKRLLKTVYNQV
ncbi:helix-turn-helix domain-containing protein [Pseudoalteromonas viridis]|uniref:Helix-turn-helix domain-containing protein n=1 Tax=Pseudoalteromonas viridis TaxID=339617 RepID=A0ABX7V564_9GAMM|nr:AraC family transcriptional regulator [Pseudoalteromonas viridis]QTL34951.1 helix-turn-helix domain-containing protein [Pseudoalteromonas viridis]